MCMARTLMKYSGSIDFVKQVVDPKKKFFRFHNSC